MRSFVRTVFERLLPRRRYDSVRHFLYPERYTYFGEAPRFEKDGLATVHRHDFTSELKFQRAYAASRDAGAWIGPWGISDPEWRAHVACWAGEHARQLAGDFVECGVYRGGLSRALVEYIDFASLSERTFWLLDSFEGIPEDQFADGEKVHDHQYDDTYDDVVRTFSAFPNVQIVKGRVPETLGQVSAEKVCYLSLDMNVSYPEIAAAEHFWDRLVPGAVKLLDDYGFLGHEFQKNAFDEFARKRGYEVLCLPTGQGIILKR